MALATFDRDGNQLNIEASLQQAILMVLTAYFQEPHLRTYLACHGDYELYALTNFEHNDAPGWCFFRSGSNYFLVISGTANAAHVAIDLNACVPEQGANTSLVHPGFGDVARQILTRLQTQGWWPPADFAGKLCVCGFSLGGAVAFVSALVLVERYGAARVQLLTMAAPRALGAGWAGTFPSVNRRVVIEGDTVPCLPPRQTQLLANALTVSPDGHGALPLYASRFRFEHYGRVFYFNRVGHLLRWADSDDSPIFGTPGVGFGPHSSAAYYRTLRAWAEANLPLSIGGADQWGMYVASVIIGDEPPDPNIQPPLPPPAPPPPVPIPEQPGLDRATLLRVAPALTELNQLFYGGLANLASDVLSQLDAASLTSDSVTFFSVPNLGIFGGIEMPAPAYSGTWKQDWIINDGQSSLQELMYFQLASPGADPLLTARGRAEEYRGLRRQLLGGVDDDSDNFYPGRPYLAHLALSDAKKTGRGGNWDTVGNAGFATPYTGITPGDTLWKRLSVKLHATTLGANPLSGHRHLLLGGLPDKLILSAQHKVVENDAWDTRWKQFRDYLVGNDGARGPVGNATSGYGMLLHDGRAGTGNEERVVIGSSIVDGAIRLKLGQSLLLAGGNAVVSMDTMQLSFANVPGWNGEYRVRVIDSKNVELVEPVRGNGRYLWDIVRTNPAALPFVTGGKLKRIRRKDGLPTWVFAPFTAATLVRIVRRRPSPAWSPYQKRRQATA